MGCVMLITIVLENWYIQPITSVLPLFNPSRCLFLSFSLSLFIFQKGRIKGSIQGPKHKLCIREDYRAQTIYWTGVLTKFKNPIQAICMLLFYHLARIFFYSRYGLERAHACHTKASKIGFLGVLIVKKLWYLSPWPMYYLSYPQRWYLVSVPRRFKE